MKKLTLIISVGLLCVYVLNIKAQNYIKIDASFFSQALDEVKMVDIYLPKDYYQHLDQQYATIYYLHGANGDQNSGQNDATWYYNPHGQDTTITSPPAIFVCPDGSCDPYGGSCWMNSTLYGSYEDYFMQDVIGFIESSFRAIPDKNFRVLTGMSMGGYGSARLSVNYPEMFRACIPQSGFLSIPDTLLNTWKELYYNENGSYVPTINSGGNTQLLLTIAGGLSPNIANPPCYVDFPFDTLGNWVDTVLSRWYQNDLSRKVKDLPDEQELSWFTICGTEDYMMTYPAYQVFTDSLRHYEIGYDSNYFDGGHEFDLESWMMVIQWLDSIINMEYQTDGIKIIDKPISHISVYPNPASDELTIKYELNKTAIVNINLMDLKGKQYKALTKDTNAIGIQTESLNISYIPPGVYFCQIQAGDQKVTKKIIKID